MADSIELEAELTKQIEEQTLETLEAEEELRKLENEELRKLENEELRKLENEELRKLENVDL